MYPAAPRYQPALTECPAPGSEGGQWPQTFRRWLRDTSGTAAIEFAQIAPMLFLGLLSMTDLGLGLNQSMTIEHVLRAGAQAALEDPGESDVLAEVDSAAELNFVLSSNNPTGVSDPLTLSVSRFCACPEATGTSVSCTTTTCADSEPTYVYYRLSAEKTYEGIILPSWTIQPSLQVQVR